ncbi:MAG: M48 family metalloprotease [Spirochaetota bacterium]|nr:MAG: M48 family metalloprotease [Spirochaetota bacterium]
MERLFNPHLQRKAKLYTKTKNILSFFELCVISVYLLLIYISGATIKITDIVTRFSMPLALLTYILIFGCPLMILIFPVSFRKDYYTEKRFGLLSQGVKGWIADQLKALILGFILGYPLMLLIFFFFSRTPDYWWLFSGILIFTIQICITFLFPVVIFPIFFKQKKVENEQLVTQIKELLMKAHIKLEAVFSFDLSSKTQRENAALAGLWKTRRVLLADTLLKKRTEAQILIVLAHEVGHHMKKHMVKLSGIGFLSTIVLLFAISRVMGLWTGFPHNLETTLVIFPVFILISGLISLPITIGTNAYSRVKELEADKTALDLTHDPSSFINVMVGLAESNLLLAYPNPLKALLFHSHPPIGKRVELAKEFDPTIV